MHELVEPSLREPESGSDAKFRALFERSAEAIALTSAEGVILDINRAAEQIFGRPSAELVGASVFALIIEDDLPLATKAIRGLLAEPAKPISLEFRVRRPDGSLVWLDAIVTNLLEAPEVAALVASFRDVTARHTAVEALQDSETRYRQVVDSSPEPILVHVGRKIAYANMASARLIGFTEPAGLVGRSIVEFATAATRAQIEARQMAVSDERRDLDLDHQSFVRVTDGVQVEAEVRSIPFVYDGQPAMLSIGRDITRRVTAEREAHDAAQRLRAQFHGLPLPTYIWQRVDRDGRKQFVLVDVNEAANAVSRGKIGDHIGESALEFFGTDPSIIEDIDRCFHQRKVSQRELDRTMRTTKEIRRMVVTYAPAPPDLVIIHTEDVTDRRKLEQQLRQAQKMEAVGRLAGGIAHDFNNILSVILSYTTMCIDELRPEDALRRDLEEVHKAGQRAVGLTRQLLAFSRQQVLAPRVIDLNAVLQGVEAMLRRLLGADIELSLLVGAGLRQVHADPGQIEQVIMNLVVNARDAMPSGGKLTIETANIDLDEGFASGHVDTKPGPYVMLAVTDTGTGMDEATRAHIFEPFFTTKAAEKGTGLGLSTVFGIVHQSGGSIWVYSEPGHGTTFKIYLPRSTGVRATTMLIPKLLGAVVGGSETILLVEDDDAVRILVRTILRRAGYNVLDTPNGGEAFMACEQFSGTIHLLVTDVVLPRMSGRQIATRLLSLRAGLKVLYMSGYSDETIVHHGVLESGVAFIQKPILSEVLLRKVREVLDEPSIG